MKKLLALFAFLILIATVLAETDSEGFTYIETCGNSLLYATGTDIFYNASQDCGGQTLVSGGGSSSEGHTSVKLYGSTMSNLAHLLPEDFNTGEVLNGTVNSTGFMLYASNPAQSGTTDVTLDGVTAYAPSFMYFGVGATGAGVLNIAYYEIKNSHLILTDKFYDTSGDSWNVVTVKIINSTIECGDASCSWGSGDILLNLEMTDSSFSGSWTPVSLISGGTGYNNHIILRNSTVPLTRSSRSGTDVTTFLEEEPIIITAKDQNGANIDGMAEIETINPKSSNFGSKNYTEHGNYYPIPIANGVGRSFIAKNYTVDGATQYTISSYNVTVKARNKLQSKIVSFASPAQESFTFDFSDEVGADTVIDNRTAGQAAVNILSNTLFPLLTILMSFAPLAVMFV